MKAKSHPLKEKQVKELVASIIKSKTLMIVSIKGLPSKQFQDIKKTLRKYAQVKVAKKNILIRSIRSVGKESILPLEKYTEENCAFVISDMEGYELAAMLNKRKTPVNAKAGQDSPCDIEVKEGPTDLVPGPAISELGAVGLQVTVQDGKLSIKNTKVIVKKGDKIKETVASILQKLKIQPFSVGLEPVAIYDITTEKVFTDIKIDSDITRKSLNESAGKALGFAQKIGYFCRETIGYFLAKANIQGEHLSKKTQLNNPEANA